MTSGSTHLGGELLVLRGKRLAVSAPWSVELDEHVLIGIGDELLEVAANGDLKISNHTSVTDS